MVVAAGYRHIRKDQSVTHVCALLKLRFEEPLDQPRGIPLLLSPMDESVSMERIGANLNLLKLIVDAKRCSNLLDALPNLFNPLSTTELLNQKRQVRLPFWRCIRIQEKRPPVNNVLEVGLPFP